MGVYQATLVVGRGGVFLTHPYLVKLKVECHLLRVFSIHLGAGALILGTQFNNFFKIFSLYFRGSIWGSI